MVFLPALQFVPDWIVTKKLIKNLDDVIFSNDDIAFFKKILATSHLIVIKWVFLVEILIILTLMMMMIFYEDDPENNIHVIPMAWCNRCKACKACKNNAKHVKMIQPKN